MANDIVLSCRKCGSKFYFTKGEQSFYKSKGLNIPKFCKNCRFKSPVKTYIPRACSTCYFRDLGVCKRTNTKLINDAPCKHWTRKV